MLVGVKEYRINRNIPEIVGNTWVDPTSVYLVKDVRVEKGFLYRVSFSQGGQILIDDESFQMIMRQPNDGPIK
jgi:hypothetical protein